MKLPSPHVSHAVVVEHHYHVECWRNGALVWEEDFDNLVVTTGKDKYLDATLKTGLAAPTWYIGLITGPGAGNVYVAADTSAVHGGWTEFTGYVAAARPTFTPGAIAAGSVDNSASKASYTINAGGTVAGAFMIDSNAKGGFIGTLLGEGNFTTGDRAVLGGDTLNVTCTCSIT